MEPTISVIEAAEPKLVKDLSATVRQELVNAARSNSLSDLHVLFKRRNGEYLGYASADEDTDIVVSITGSLSRPQKFLIEDVIPRSANKYRKLGGVELGLLRVLAPFLSRD